MLEFLRLCTLDGRVTYLQIDNGRTVSITDNERVTFIYGTYKKESYFQKTLKFSDSAYLLKVVTLLQDKTSKFILSDNQLLVKSKFGKFSLELLSECPNYVVEGKSSLEKILGGLKTKYLIDDKIANKYLSVYALYKKPLISVVQSDKENLALCFIETNPGSGKQPGIISLVGKYPSDWKLEEKEMKGMGWYSGEVLAAILEKVSGNKLSVTMWYKETVPLVVAVKSKEFELNYCIAPTETI